MPRRNRRTRSTPFRPCRRLTPAQLHSLRACASEHLARHAQAQEHTPAGHTAVSGSEDRETGIRFLSVGARLDERAVGLTRAAYSSDAAEKLAS